MSKIVKNITGSPINIVDTGVTVLASSQYTIPPQDYLLWAASDNVITHIGSGDIVVNDGNVDLSISDGTDLIKDIFPKRMGVLAGDDLTQIGHAGDRLKVDAAITSLGGGGIMSWTPKLVYLDMNASSGGVSRNSVINTNWTNVFSYSGSGLLSGWSLSLEDNKKWEIRLIVDSMEIFGSSGMSMLDFDDHAIYGLARDNGDMANSGINMNSKTSPIFWSGPLDFPISYSSNVTIKVKRINGENSKKFKAGLVVLTKET